MADANHDEARNTFRRAGFHTDHPADAHFAQNVNGKIVLKKPKFGRADFICTGNNMGFAVEAKMGTGNNKQSFPFRRWETHQRKWALRYQQQYNNTYWLFITLGKYLDSYKKGQKYPKISILIPANRVLQLEQELDRKSIPYDWARDCEYRLEWNGNQSWAIPIGHPFWSHYGPSPFMWSMILLWQRGNYVNSTRNISRTA